MVQKPPLKGGGDVGCLLRAYPPFPEPEEKYTRSRHASLVVFVISRQEYAWFVAGLIQLRSIQTLALRLIDARVGD